MSASSAAAPLELLAFPDSLALASKVAGLLGVAALPIEVHAFPDGESLVRAVRRAQGEAARVLVFRSLDDPNQKLLEVLFAADALRRQGARSVGLVAPYLGYMRQDRVFREGEPISQRVVAGLLDTGFDEVLTVEAHLHRIEHLGQIFRARARSVSAAEPIADWLRSGSRADLLVGPDAESLPWIRDIARRANRTWCLGSKTRHSDREVRIDLPELPAGVRSAWIIDDIASSGGTLEAIVRILKQRGVGRIGAIVVHPLLAPGTAARLARAGLDELVSADGIEHETNAIGLAPLLARSILEHEEQGADT